MIFFLSILLLGNSSFANEIKNISAVGPHYPIFQVEKNIHPENKMVVYTKLNDACELSIDENQNPTFDFYWLMKGTDYKPTHSLIKAQIRKRMAITAGDSKKSFSINIQDLKELNTDLKDPQMKVTANKAKKGKYCSVEGRMTLGPSDQNQVMIVQSIDTKAEGTFQPKVLAVTLKGISASTGKPLNRTYMGRSD